MGPYASYKYDPNNWDSMSAITARMNSNNDREEWAIVRSEKADPTPFDADLDGANNQASVQCGGEKNVSCRLDLILVETGRLQCLDGRCDRKDGRCLGFDRWLKKKRDESVLGTGPGAAIYKAWHESYKEQTGNAWAVSLFSKEDIAEPSGDRNYPGDVRNNMLRSIQSLVSGGEFYCDNCIRYHGGLNQGRDVATGQLFPGWRMGVFWRWLSAEAGKVCGDPDRAMEKIDRDRREGRSSGGGRRGRGRRDAFAGYADDEDEDDEDDDDFDDGDSELEIGSDSAEDDDSGRSRRGRRRRGRDRRGHGHGRKRRRSSYSSRRDADEDEEDAADSGDRPASADSLAQLLQTLTQTQQLGTAAVGVGAAAPVVNPAVAGLQGQLAQLQAVAQQQLVNQQQLLAAQQVQAGATVAGVSPAPLAKAKSRLHRFARGGGSKRKSRAKSKSKRSKAVQRRRALDRRSRRGGGRRGRSKFED